MMDSAVEQQDLYTEERSWYVVYTIVRHEKSVNAALTDKEVDTFLPIKKTISRWKDRMKEVHIPLFPGYLFVNSSLEDRLKILNTRGVIKILGVNGFPTPVPSEQIEIIKTILEKDLNCDPWPYMTEGKEVIVIRGPLEGTSGKIVERRGECRLILSVDLIKRSVSVEVDIDDVELNQ
ncbi:MAG: transcription termination factor NusG domain protein [Thermodesulfobacteriota bacterium]|nr:MAG: transcription termination factor NusG domain protein [Thermodesulfobacteriota bacterium]